LKAGSGSRVFLGNVTNGFALQAQAQASAVNSVVVFGTATGSAPTIQSTGDTNLDLNLKANGTGTLQAGSSGSWSANGAVATALTSVGPTGAATTVQKWLTIKDNGGVIRYIPCF
jgi:hypothetical protein